DFRRALVPLVDDGGGALRPAGDPRLGGLFAHVGPDAHGADVVAGRRGPIRDRDVRMRARLDLDWDRGCSGDGSGGGVGWSDRRLESAGGLSLRELLIDPAGAA